MNKITQHDLVIVNKAMEVLKKYIVKSDVLTSSEMTKNYIKLKLAGESAEHFGVMFLDNQHKVIEDRVMFTGTIDSCAVYPREVAQLSLELSANAVILYHNHPSGLPEPSQADLQITSRIKAALSLFDIKLLDHIIVGDDKAVSFADRSLI